MRFAVILQELGKISVIIKIQQDFIFLANFVVSLSTILPNNINVKTYLLIFFQDWNNILTFSSIVALLSLLFSFQGAMVGLRLLESHSQNSLILASLVKANLVGLRGLEPPTLRLSGVRSNHLSYKPMRY